MADLTNRSRFRVTVKNRDDLTRHFSFNQLDDVEAYMAEKRKQHLKPRVEQLDESWLVRIRDKGHKPLTSLSGEGRSSATTMLTLSALRYLYEQDQQLSAEAKKVLGFSDNRQDAALQAGHFNDFLQVLLTRAALLTAVQKGGGQALSEREVANAVFEALGFHRDDPAVRAEYMQQPEVKGNTRRQVQEAMRGILGYRTYFDLRRGWRFNNPNLEQLGLVRIGYQDIDDLAADTAEWAEAPQVLQAAKPDLPPSAVPVLRKESGLKVT